MTVALAKDEASYFSRTQIDVIKNVLCPGINDQQLSMFSEVCKRTGLDPFAKQIYVTIRNTWDASLQRKVPRMTIQTGIDGFRLIAERTGKYGGQGMFEWCGPDGVWKDVWLSDQPPSAARATVHRKDWDKPLTRVARYKSYVQTNSDGKPNSMWAKMDAEQLAKCAEALGLRTAFPQELSGLYTDDEMAQADNEPVRATVVSRAPKNALHAPERKPVDIAGKLQANIDLREGDAFEGTEGGGWVAGDPEPLTTAVDTFIAKDEALRAEIAKRSAEPLRFAAKYPECGGQLIEEATASAILRYIEACSSRALTPQQRKHIECVQEYYEQRIAAEMDADKEAEAADHE